MSSLTLPLLRQAVGGDPRKAEVINVSSRSLADLDGLKLLDRTKVLTLDASGNELSDVDGLANCAATLQHLNIARNAVAHAEPLGVLPQLRSLDASHNRLARLAALASLKRLAKLDVSNNALSGDALLPLATLPLVSLDVSHNPLQSWPRALCALPALQTLRLNDTGLSRLNSLAAMRALRWLHLSDNALAGNVSWAAGMPALHSLWIARNADLVDLNALASLSTLTMVDCTGCAGASTLRCGPGVRIVTGMPDAPAQDANDGKKERKKKHKKAKKRASEPAAATGSGDVGPDAPAQNDVEEAAPKAGKKARKQRRVVDRTGQVVAVVADAPAAAAPAPTTTSKKKKRKKSKQQGGDLATDADAVLAALSGSSGAAGWDE